jgi:hypothetical protein
VCVKSYPAFECCSHKEFKRNAAAATIEALNSSELDAASVIDSLEDGVIQDIAQLRELFGIDEKTFIEKVKETFERRFRPFLGMILTSAATPTIRSGAIGLSNLSTAAGVNSPMGAITAFQSAMSCIEQILQLIGFTSIPVDGSIPNRIVDFLIGRAFGAEHTAGLSKILASDCVKKTTRSHGQMG